jgi:hypothetical protein
MNTNNLWFLLAVFGMSMLSWVIGKLREQAKIKAAKDAARRRYEESLRTGRVADEPAKPTAVAPRNQDLAERRQAQLRELRKQQEAGRGGTTVVARPAPAGGGAGPGMPGRVVIQRGGAPPGRPSTAKPQAGLREGAATSIEMEDPRVALARKRAAEQAERERAALAAERAEEEAVRAEQARYASQQTARAAAASRGADSPRRRAGALAGALAGADLRRAVVLTEVLGKPVAMRE